MDPSALRSELELAGWDPRALEGRALCLRLDSRTWAGYTVMMIEAFASLARTAGGRGGG